MESSGSGGKVRVLPEDVGARRGSAAGGDGLSARDCGCQRGGQRHGAGKADEVAWQHAHDAHAAGTAANLDELRARVQLQSQQQTLIAAQNAEEKDLILLKREIGIDPGQKIMLTDPAPYSDLAEQTPAEVRAVAYKNRQDYQNLQNQVIEVTRGAHGLSGAAAAELELQRLLRRRQGEWQSEPRRLCRDGNAECSDLSRGEHSRRSRRVRRRSWPR